VRTFPKHSSNILPLTGREGFRNRQVAARRETVLFCRTKFYYAANLHLVAGKCRLDFSSIQFPPIETQIGRFFFYSFFVATEEGYFATRSNLTVTTTPFETRWLRKKRLAARRLMLMAIELSGTDS